eukprot:CAMPEP_0176395228 /NCGR_PEP_ID=MMETSP0126-20121128/43239_1 /TAXON_ID=141414 ORGANISM="Strombidinopsis acuminatum, Strain SPMC142" /NCGR_SAMPLE_ID=MMETSP0126 /ASSEMBLY_ACC=CAM_ASM_000229 /LENGTH=50 /DNA_ID=CAMNT_0017767977 /DNA_START=1013 /DNA_END=1165 /DNA_ORIENTATION=+
MKIVNMYNLIKKVTWRCSDDLKQVDLNLYSSMVHEINQKLFIKNKMTELG